MSRKNYTNYSNVNANAEPVAVPENVVEPTVDTEPVATVEAPEVAVEPEVKTVYGFVDNCDKLNIRKKPTKNSEAICVINAKAEVEIDETNSTNDWYSVRTAAGIEGFCMKNFITLK